MDKLNLEVEWQVDNAKLRSDMAEGRKVIEGVGQSVDKVQQQVEANIKAVASGQNQLAKSYQQLQIQAQAYANIAAKSHDPAVIAKYNQRLVEIKAEMNRIANIGKDGFDSMGNSLSKASTASAALTKGLGRAYTAISRLAYLIPGLGIAGLLSLAWDPLWKLIQGTGLFTKKLSDAEKEAKRLGAALDSSEYKKAIVSISELKTNVDLAKKGLYDKKTALNEYNSTIGAVAGQLTEFNQIEQALIDNADLYIEMTLKKAAATAASEEAAEKMIELRKEMLKSDIEFANRSDRYAASMSSYSSNMYGTSTLNIETYNSVLKEEGAKRKKAHELQKKRDIKALEDIAKEFNNEVAGIVKEMGGVLGFDQTKDKPKNTGLDKTVDEANRLFQKIEDLRSEYSRRSMSKDEAELQALRDRFSKIALEIQKFNKNPKNKIKIPIDQLDDIRDGAIADLQYSQGTVQLQKQYADEYKVFQSYEQLKKDTSEQYANERYADQLEAIKSYEARLAQEIASIDPATTNALEKKRLEGLLALQKDQSDKRKEAEDKAMSDLLALMVTYDQRRKKLLEKHEADRRKVAETASAEELAELDRHHAEELGKLDDANIQKLDAHKELFEGIQHLSDVAARRVIANAKAMLAADLNITDEERLKIEKAIAEAEQSLNDRLYDRVDNLADAFGQMASSIGQVNEGLGDMLGLVSNVLRATVDVNKGIADLRTGLANYQTNKADGGGGILGSISAIAGVAGSVGQIVGAVSSVVSGVVRFFKASKESARQAAEEIRKYQESVLAGELEHNRLLRERAREQQNINDLTNEQIRLQSRLLDTQTSEAQREFDDLLRRIQREGEQITGKRTEKYGGFLGIGRKTRVVDITQGLAGYTYEQLEELYNSNKLTQATRALFEELQKAKNEIDGIADAWDALNEEFLSRMSGGATADAIASSIIDGFKNGKRAVSDFADDMETIIQNALLSAMSYTVLDEPLQELIRQFREDAKDGLSNEEIERFKKEYGEIVQAGIDAVGQIEELTGRQIGKANSTLTSTGIERITQEQAGQMDGYLRSSNDLHRRQVQLAEKTIAFNEKANETMIAQLRHLAAIETNTAETVAALKDGIAPLLVAIKDNTGIIVKRG